MFILDGAKTIILAAAFVSNASARSPAFISQPAIHKNTNGNVNGSPNTFLPATNVNGDNSIIEGLVQKCTSVSAALLTAGALCLPISQPCLEEIEGRSFLFPQMQQLVQAQPAFASDIETGPNSLIKNLNRDIALDANDDKEILLRRQRSTVLDEVWTLANKYFVDNTHNSQDWNQVRENYESRLSFNKDGSYDDEEAMKISIAMVKLLGDKYSRILDQPAYARIQKFDLIGVGATFMPNADKKIIVGAPPVQGSEADKGGLKIGDFIVAVNGVETQGRTAFDIIDQIAENPNAQVVTMTVVTQGSDDMIGEGYRRDVTMKRQTMEVKNPVTYKITEKRNDGTIVGYIRISEFNSLVKPKLEDAIKSLKASGANAFVMDLRQNPGGAFQSAVEIAGLFLDDKIATNVIDSNQVEMVFRTTKGKTLLEPSIPLVIWQDGGSASASEVLAGALHDQCRAVVMGSNSFGKGLIQAVYGLKNGSGFVLTVAKYQTPGGTDIQGIGITPDIEAKLPTPLIIGLSTDTSIVDFKGAAAKACPVTASD
jgi:carboxyl-terminal processing protease